MGAPSGDRQGQGVAYGPLQRSERSGYDTGKPSMNDATFASEATLCFSLAAWERCCAGQRIKTCGADGTDEAVSPGVRNWEYQAWLA